MFRSLETGRIYCIFSLSLSLDKDVCALSAISTDNKQGANNRAETPDALMLRTIAFPPSPLASASPSTALCTSCECDL
jgi:hypothetical protein